MTIFVFLSTFTDPSLLSSVPNTNLWVLSLNSIASITSFNIFFLGNFKPIV